MKRRFGDNPFYVLLVAAGIAFTLTAASYFVMTLQAERAATADVEFERREEGLAGFLRRHGAWLMAAELAALAVFCAAAMFSDDYWTRRAVQRREWIAVENEGKTPDTRLPTPDTSVTP